MASPTPTGIMPAMFTPLNDDHTVNYDIIPAYAKYLRDAGVTNYLVCGTTSECMTLSVAERKKLIQAWMSETKEGRQHIQVQVGGAPLADVLELARYCQEIGINSLLTLPELYFKPSNVEELVSYVSKVAQAAPKLSIFYYNSPIRTGVQVHMPTFVKAATASIPNFKGIKFASKDLVEAAQVQRVLKDGQKLLFAGETFLGEWYEIERFPTWYEQYGNCAYKRLQYCARRIEIEHIFVRDGIQFVLHVNSSYTPGDKPVFEIQGNNVDPVGIPLSVISTDYTNYAVIYGCKTNEDIDIKYLLAWIVSRTPSLSQEILKKAYQELNSIPFASVAYLEKVDHSDKQCVHHWTAHVQAENITEAMRADMMLENGFFGFV